jgi:predicted dehydrogenase
MIGAGRYAQHHLDVLTHMPGVRVVALCSRTREKGKPVAAKYSIPAYYTDYRKMLDEANLDAVFVVVSIVNNVEVGAECLRRGMNAFLEKPPGLCPADTAMLSDVAVQSGARHMVGFNRRFYSIVQRAQEVIAEAGPLISVVVEAPERFDMAEASGRFPDEVLRKWMVANGIHCLDLLRYLGGRVTQVYSLTGQWTEDQPDSFGALIRFESGIIGHYISNWAAPGNWSVTLYGLDRRVELKPLERGVVLLRDGTQQELPVDEVDQRFRPGLYAQDQYFVERVRRGESIGHPAATLDDALETMRLIEAIRGGDVIVDEPAKSWEV